MKKRKSLLWTVLRCYGWIIVLSTTFAAGYWTAKLTFTPTREPPLPSIQAIQERVGAVPDGILGPETQQKWQRALCDQHAIDAFRRFGVEDEFVVED